MLKNIGFSGAVVGVAGLLVALLAFGDERDSNAVPQPVLFPPARIAVVDLEKVLEGMDRRAKLEAEIREEFEAKKASLEELQKVIQRLQGELELLKPGSDEGKRIQREIAQKEAEVDFNKKQYTADIEEKRNRHFDGLLAQIQAVTREYAHERGINLVLQRQLRIQPEVPPWESVVFAEDPLDITSDIVEILNKP